MNGFLDQRGRIQKELARLEREHKTDSD